MISRHRVVLAVLLLGNSIAFAGVDPPARLVTACLVMWLVADLKKIPDVPRMHLLAVIGLTVLVMVQLMPLPMAIRQLLQPGFSHVMASGWAPLSLAPWSTIHAAAAALVALGIALTAARMAATRSGLPVLLAMIAATGALLAILGMAGEAGSPDKVLLIRDNTGGGSPYGPFVNRNHFAQAIELTLPAGLVLLAVSARQLRQSRGRRSGAAVILLTAAVTTVVAVAAILRSGSRGGAFFLATAVIVTLPLWLRPGRFRGARWPAVTMVVALFVVVGALSWARLPALQEGFRELLVVEGVEGNTRWDFWTATARSWRRSPVVGSGFGSYRDVIGLDKPATGTAVLEQAHNDWLEWTSTTGVAGVVVLSLFVVGLGTRLTPSRARRLRFEFRYPMAGIALAMVATALHESVGFGLQTPLNLYLLAAWTGMCWGLGPRSNQADRADGGRGKDEENNHERSRSRSRSDGPAPSAHADDDRSGVDVDSRSGCGDGVSAPSGGVDSADGGDLDHAGGCAVARVHSPS
jgi:hypothetical protein